jgi:hypothetical protein
MLYPTYLMDGSGKATIQAQAPLIRVKMMNMITNERTHFPIDASTGTAGVDTEADLSAIEQQIEAAAIGESPQEVIANYRTNPLPSNGVLAAISNYTYRSDLTKVAIFEHAPNTILPQALTVSLSFSVIHEEVLGWDELGNPLARSFPHKVEGYMTPDGKSVGDDMNPRDIATRMQDERDSQAEMDNARAHNARFMSSLGRGIGKGVHAYTAALAKPLGPGKKD